MPDEIIVLSGEPPMNYYHANERNEPVGPYTAEQIRHFYWQGVIHENSWLIAEGATQWQSYAALFQSAGVQPPPGSPPPQYATVLPAVAAPPPMLPLPTVDPSYRGYGGWLAFLGALLVYVGPILTFIRVIRSFLNLHRVRGYDGSAMILLENVGYFGVSIFGLFAGIMLHQLKPGAIRTTRLYFMLLLLWAATAILFPQLCDFSGAKQRYVTNLVIDQVLSFFITLAYVVAWMCYLSNSKRVKATYV